MDTPFDLEDLPYRYIIGIDLGTTNSAVAYVDRTRDEGERRTIHFLEIPQLVSPGELGRRPVLPSFLYLPGPYELPPGSTALPWDQDRDYAVGEFAREQGARVPGRLVTSAKSWLCHGGVDRGGNILPWGAGEDVAKVSPVEASARFLLHMREAWDRTIAKGREGYRMEEQLVILTVPASFDEVARELTVASAMRAGLTRVVLLEEPLAAFYAWLSRHEEDWLTGMRPGQLILVCDVGGGTTDFTIVAIREGEKGLRFDRLAVGDHLMLGGDNMDLSIARHLEMKLLGQPGQLDSRRWHQLSHQCRKAKEELLKPAPRDTVDITLMGTGGKLIAGTLKATLSRPRVEELILDGFFPAISLQESPQSARRTGLTEWGLPYVQDPAVTRHLAGFWQRFRTLLHQETGRDALYPDYLLFNGGALTPHSVRRRILSVVQQWFQSEAGADWQPQELKNPRPELAVAIGAAYYGMVRVGEGVRVGAGSPRAYFVEVVTDGTARKTGEADSPDDLAARTAVCLVSRGTEEGFEAQLDQLAFEVLTNQPVAFQLFSSSTRLGDHLGDLVALSHEEVTALPPIRTVLRFGKKSTAQTLPVRLAVRLTEIGTLELWCHSQATPHKWQLQFDVRQEGEPAPEAGGIPGETLDVDVIQQAREAIRWVFGEDRKAEGTASPPERLGKQLASILDLKKEKWPTSLIRKFADSLLESRQGRVTTSDHEARWYNLLGYCLRPGFGAPLDEWRIKEIWKLFPQGLVFSRQAQCRSEWWIFWRRVAGGLSTGQQLHIYQQLSPMLKSQEGEKRKAPKKLGKTMGLQEEMEIRMALANFERLPAGIKVELGRLVLQEIGHRKPKPQELWTLGRLGARTPFYGPLDQVVPRGEAETWVGALLNLSQESPEALAQTLVNIARRTGDRERDLDPRIREQVDAWLSHKPQNKRLRELLHNPETPLMDQEQDWIFGEALPAGLIVTQ